MYQNREGGLCDEKSPASALALALQNLGVMPQKENAQSNDTDHEEKDIHKLARIVSCSPSSENQAERPHGKPFDDTMAAGLASGISRSESELSDSIESLRSSEAAEQSSVEARHSSASRSGPHITVSVPVSEARQQAVAIDTH